MGLPQKNTSLEGFDDLWEATDSSEANPSVDATSKQIQAILKVLVDDRIALKQENNLVQELKQHMTTLENQIQKVNWQLGQREKELSDLHSDFYKAKSEKDKLEKNQSDYKEVLQENKEIRKLTEQLSNQILQEKAKNEMLVQLLKELKQPELAKIEKKLGI